MATVADMPLMSGFEETPYLITTELFTQMVEQGMIPRDRRVFLWGGRLYEKMAKSKAHSAVQNAFIGALSRRLPQGLFVGAENPVRLDETHLPLPDLVVARGNPLDYFDSRYPDGRDVLLVVEVAVSSLPDDLGARLSRYALTLPSAVDLVADVHHHQLLVHTRPSATGEYEERVITRPGEVLRLQLGGIDLEPIPFEEVMR